MKSPKIIGSFSRFLLQWFLVALKQPIRSEKFVLSGERACNNLTRFSLSWTFMTTETTSKFWKTSSWISWNYNGLFTNITHPSVWTRDLHTSKLLNPDIWPWKFDTVTMSKLLSFLWRSSDEHGCNKNPTMLTCISENLDLYLSSEFWSNSSVNFLGNFASFIKCRVATIIIHAVNIIKWYTFVTVIM